MRRTKEEAEVTRQGVLEAALNVFSRKGYEATRLEDIAEAAGVTRGAIYHHFGGKPGLFMTLIKQATEQSSQAINRAIAEGGDFLTTTRRVLVYTLRLVGEDTRFREIMSLLLFKTGASDELSELQQTRRAQSVSQVEAIAGYFEIGVSQNQLRDGLAPLTAARAFLAYQDGLVTLWLTNPQVFSIEKEAEPLADVFMRGIVKG